MTINTSVPVFTVFLQGLLSFFSPCVLPLLPVYIGYLSGGTLSKDESGMWHYNRKKVMLNTVFFTIGVSFAFFLLGLGLSALGRFFSGNQMLFARIGGIIVVMFGLYQLGFFGKSELLSGEKRLPFDVSKMTMSPLVALIFGFVLSFSWSPCIGPVLSSVLIMAASAGSAASGFMLIGVYTLGYIIPFLLVGVFTTSLLEFFGKHRNLVKYTTKIGGVVLILMGILMFTGKMNGITSYLSRISGSNTVNVEEKAESKEDAESLPGKDQNRDPEDTANADAESNTASENNATPENNAESESKEDPSSEASESKAKDLLPAPEFTLTDQYGSEHTLSDYKGKIVFLNFWATWCPPCKAELPYIEELYKEYSSKEDADVTFLTVTFPDYGSELSIEGITEFAESNGYTFPILMDTSTNLADDYYITAFPTTYIIDPDGYVLGYVPGGMTKDIMEDVLDQAREMSK